MIAPLSGGLLRFSTGGRAPYHNIQVMSRWSIPIAALALTCLVVAVFFPILGFEFINYDVGQQVFLNPHVQALTGENLKHMLTSPCITSYYPVRTLTYAVDYHFWGLNPRGFKLTNGLIHLANVFLVFWLILRLFGPAAGPGGRSRPWWDVSVAAFSAGVSAIHPVVVEPVAWVAGREELLMTLGALVCFHSHLTAHRLSEKGKRSRASVGHVAAAFSCALACLSNAVAAVIPLLVTTWDILTLPRPRLTKILRGTAALWVIGTATVTIKILSGDPESIALEVDIASVERLMLVLKVYWLNLKTLVWPMDLAVYYWRLTPKSFVEWEVALGGIAVLLTCLILWKLRRRKLILFGLLWFGLALGPSSQLLTHHVHRADRFLYLPLVGLAICVAMGLRPLGQALNTRTAVAGVVGAGALVLLLLGVRSADQLQTWRDSLTMWEHCAQVERKNAFAHDRLASYLKLRGQSRRAIEHAVRGLELDFAGNPGALHDRAVQLATSPDERLRDYGLALRLAVRACELTEWEDPRFLHTLAVVHSALANVQAEKGQFVWAVANYTKAIEADGQYGLALSNLAILLSNCPDQRLRNPEGAVRLAERAYELAKSPDPHGLSILAGAYLAAGRRDDALAAAREAVRLAQVAGDGQSKDPEHRRTLAEVHCTLANAQAKNREFVAALESYTKAIEVEPEYDTALLNLANLLTICTDQSVRNPEEAVRLAERACELAEAPDPRRLRILAEAYLAAGRRDRAVATAREAARIARAAGDLKLAESASRWADDLEAAPGSANPD